MPQQNDYLDHCSVWCLCLVWSCSIRSSSSSSSSEKEGVFRRQESELLGQEGRAAWAGEGVQHTTGVVGEMRVLGSNTARWMSVVPATRRPCSLGSAGLKWKKVDKEAERSEK